MSSEFDCYVTTKSFDQPNNILRGSSMYSFTYTNSLNHERLKLRITDLNEENHSFSSIKQSMIISKCKIHHLTPKVNSSRETSSCPMNHKPVESQFCHQRPQVYLWLHVNPEQLKAQLVVPLARFDLGDEPVCGKLIIGVPISEPKTPP